MYIEEEERKFAIMPSLIKFNKGLFSNWFTGGLFVVEQGNERTQVKSACFDVSVL